jgi:hypothetical protein
VGLIRTGKVGECITVTIVAICVTAWPNYLSAHVHQQLSSHILTRPTTHKTHYRLDLQIEHANESGI